tara:strand:- start:67 stop:969 length:903 start_codon:yes stop_codon:yes gene_type:complete
MYYLSIDIGGTTFSSGVFDEKLNCINKSSLGYISECDSSKEGLVESISNQIKKLYLDLEIKKEHIFGVGVSCPGPLDIDSGRILDTPNLKQFANFNIKDELNKLLNIPVWINNDANLFALGEWYSSFSEVDNLVGITLGTGLGLGIVLNKQLYLGSHKMAAEYGISPNNQRGTWEDLLSIRAISKSTQEITGKAISPEQLFEMAEQKDSMALEIWSKFGDKLGIVLSQIINMLDPKVITIGGGLSYNFKYFHGQCLQKVSQNCPAYQRFGIEIVESIYKEESALVGAALMVKNKLNKEFV